MGNDNTVRGDSGDKANDNTVSCYSDDMVNNNSEWWQW